MFYNVDFNLNQNEFWLKNKLEEIGCTDVVIMDSDEEDLQTGNLEETDDDDEEEDEDEEELDKEDSEGNQYT